MPADHLVLLTVAAILAGAINAVAGGGTILTFPALLATGVPAIEANATSTLALLLGIVGSVFGYRSRLALVGRSLRRLWPVSLAGGLLGAILLTRTPPEAFERLVPYLLLLATLLFMAQNAFRRLADTEAAGPPHPAISLLLQFGVALYGGYFGAGIGILMLAVFGLLGLQDIHEMNALKTVLSAVINLVAALYFIHTGLIKWPQAAVLTAGATVGYFAGAHLSLKVSPARVRHLVAAIGLAISAAIFWKQLS